MSEGYPPTLRSSFSEILIPFIILIQSDRILKRSQVIGDPNRYQLTIYPVTNLQSVFMRLKMNVGRPINDGAGPFIDKTDNRSVLILQIICVVLSSKSMSESSRPSAPIQSFQ